jgi:hypothetical protein
MTPEEKKQQIAAYGDSPAFSKPISYYSHGNVDHPQQGMTLREYFAAKAMQGLITRETVVDISYAASMSVAYADALIEQLLKPR